MTIPELIGKARNNGLLTKQQADSLQRHHKLHSESHMLLMLQLMIEKSLTFEEAHQKTMQRIGK